MPVITRAELLSMDGNTEESIAADLKIWERDHEHKALEEWLEVNREKFPAMYINLQWHSAGMPHVEEECGDPMYCPRHAPENRDELKVLAVHRCLHPWGE